MRHGERAPQDTYPNDPYLNNSMEPYGWGQLTNEGEINTIKVFFYEKNIIIFWVQHIVLIYFICNLQQLIVQKCLLC